jgi:GNAT superfamily N-acetyltransferase
MNRPFVHLNSSDVTPAHALLFNADEPAAPRLFAVLDGSAAGRIITDDLMRPTWCIVQEAGDGSIYLGGAVDAPLLSEVIAVLRADGAVAVGLRPDDPRRALLPPDPDYIGGTLDFLERRPDNGWSAGLESLGLPEGCRLVPINHALFDRCAWRDHEIDIYGGVDRFFIYGLGYCLIKGDEVLSEAYAGPAARGWMEIGTNTHHAYRRRGFAALVCAQAIAGCEARGHRPWWNCAVSNVGSAALARKLGFYAEREYVVMAWSRQA